MSTALSTSSFPDTYHKMDNILYEIRDSKGIPKNKFYEPWKKDLLSELNFSGFIVQKSDLYVLTEEGREVIKNISFKVYNQKPKFEAIKAEEKVLQGKAKKLL